MSRTGPTDVLRKRRRQRRMLDRDKRATQGLVWQHTPRWLRLGPRIRRGAGAPGGAVQIEVLAGRVRVRRVRRRRR